MGEHRQGEKTVSDGPSEGRLGCGAIGVDVDELMIMGEIGKRIDLVLPDRVPVTDDFSASDPFLHHIKCSRCVAHLALPSPPQFEEPDRLLEPLQIALPLLHEVIPFAGNKLSHQG